jgi:type IV pilus assembly protein PilB
MNLLKQLVQKGLLDKEKSVDIEYEIKNSGKKEEEIIIEKRIVSESFLFGLKSDLLKIPLKDVDISVISIKTLQLIPEEAARVYFFIPISKKDDLVEIGMVYPEDIRAQEALEFIARQNKFSYKIFLITLSTFKNLLKKYKTLKSEVSRALEELETELYEKKVEKESRTVVSDFEKMAEEAPISKVVAVLLRHAVEGEASDIHIEPTKEKIRVRFRVDGILHSSIFLPLRILPAVVSRIKILSNLKIDETRVPQDGRFTTKIDDREIDFRVSTFPTVLGEKVVMRILDPAKALSDIKGLGLSDFNFKILDKAIKKPYGMILVTGPTGSGKTTTLYAILKALNKEGVNIMTLEDPVEYFIEGINQSQVRPEIGYEFSTGLRHMLRQDPDILMVGEIRDEETANLAIHSSLTGHLLLSTLHTNTSIGVIPRLIDIGIKPFFIPPTLIIAIGQRLVRILCNECKDKVKITGDIKELIQKEINDIPLLTKKQLKIPNTSYIFKPVGCNKCMQTGYSGRTGIYEILEMTDEIAEIILKTPSENDILKAAREKGFVSMKQDGMIKVLQGVTSLEEVLSVAE